MPDSPLWPLAVYFVSVVALVGIILLLSSLVGQKSTMSRATGEPFESGVVHIGSAQIPVSVEFYLIAIFFVIFDLETVFIFAWAIAFHELGVFGYLAVSVFIFVLIVALAFEWKSGALEWGVKTRTGLKQNGETPRAQNYTLQPLED